MPILRSKHNHMLQDYLHNLFYHSKKLNNIANDIYCKLGQSNVLLILLLISYVLSIINRQTCKIYRLKKSIFIPSKNKTQSKC